MVELQQRLDFDSTTAKCLPKSFQGTMFIPTHVSPMQQCLSNESGMPTFAEDLPGKTGAKRFFACGYLHFINVYYSGRVHKPGAPPSFHEVLDPNKPTRVFFDLDYKTGESSENEQALQFMQDFAAHARSSCVEAFGLDDEPEVMILDGTTDQKLSWHIVLDLFATTVSEVRDACEFILQSFTGCSEMASNIVDKSVYAKNHCFRLVWSCKKNHPLGTLRVKGCGPKDFDANILRRSLLQCRLPNEPVRRLKVANVRTPSVRRNWSGEEVTSVSAASFPPQILNLFIKPALGPRVSIATTRMSKDVLQCVVVNAVCFWTKRPHRSNNQYFHYNVKTHQAWFRCSDYSCPQIRYLKTDIRFTMCEWPCQNFHNNDNDDSSDEEDEDADLER